MLQDVSIDNVMKIAKLVANATDSIKEEKIFRGLEADEKEQKILRRALRTCVDLNIIQKRGTEYNISTEYISDIKNCKIDELYIFFRKALQNFSPFLLYINLLYQGMDATSAAKYVKTLFQLKNSSKQIQTILLRWGTGCKILKKIGKNYNIPSLENPPPKQQLDKLLNSLDNEMTTKNYLIDILDAKTFAFLSNHNLDLNDITNSLLDHERNSKTAMSNGTSFFEHFLRKVCHELEIDVSKLNGIGGIIKKLLEEGKINHALMGLGQGVNGCRIISSHGIDKQTAIKWSITPITSLMSVLFTVLTIKSYYLSIKHNEYNF